jgi:hypothetical protein
MVVVAIDTPLQHRPIFSIEKRWSILSGLCFWAFWAQLGFAAFPNIQEYFLHRVYVFIYTTLLNTKPRL